MLRLAIVGCGDVSSRRYIPALRALSSRVELAYCCDRDPGRARRAAESCADWSPTVRVCADVSELLEDGQLDGAFDLTPAPHHYETNLLLLEAGLHVFSEKPLAMEVAEAHELCRAARERELTLMCAPAVMAAPRFRCLAELIESGRIGQPTLVSAQHGDMGPAGWRLYRGDPGLYHRDVGPLMDEGIYLLHAVTGLLGSATSVSAIGTTALPTRTVVAGESAGQTIRVTTHDHMLVQLKLASGALAQILSSYAVRASQAPTLEIHGTAGTISLRNLFSADGDFEVFIGDDGPVGLEGWLRYAPALPPDRTEPNLVAAGAAHFVRCLEGREPELLSPEHASHVLEIVLAARASAAEGRAQLLETGLAALS